MGVYMNAEIYTDRIIAFLNDIGIPVELKDLPEGTFLPGVRIEHGGLAVDTARLSYPGDLLHEAGHIAVMPPSRRPEAFADAGADMGEEIAAQAWSYAAAKACDVPPEVVFHQHGYKGASNWLKEHYEGEHAFAGLPLLAWFRLTDMPAADPEQIPETPFPKMKAWLRAHDNPSLVP